MTDVHTREIRSKNMSAIKAVGNKSTEELFRELLKETQIKGWRRHNKKVVGKPDFSFSSQKLAIFLDGCFWHACPVCYIAPTSNAQYWSQKIEQNQKRDNLVNKTLAEKHWRVIRIWEHKLKKEPNEVITELAESL